MKQAFGNILIPVDLSINTEIAVKKAIELAEDGTVFQLLHVRTLSIPPFSATKDDNPLDGKPDLIAQKIDLRLQQWKSSIEDHTRNIRVHTWVVIRDSIQSAIEEKAIKLKADLIIIGKNSNHSILPFLNTVVPSKIVKNTGIPVLTVKPGSFHNKTRTVVIPISAENP